VIQQHSQSYLMNNQCCQGQPEEEQGQAEFEIQESLESESGLKLAGNGRRGSL